MPPMVSQITIFYSDRTVHKYKILSVVKTRLSAPPLLKITDYIGQKQRVTLQYVQNNLKN